MIAPNEMGRKDILVRMLNLEALNDDLSLGAIWVSLIGFMSTYVCVYIYMCDAVLAAVCALQCCIDAYIDVNLDIGLKQNLRTQKQKG